MTATIFLLFVACLLFSHRIARADTPPSLFTSFAGYVNFVGTEKTLRTASNDTNSCSVLSSTTTTSATLSGIPTSATIKAAYLYWAGSGSTPDYTVNFGVSGSMSSVTAPSSRQYTATFTTGGTTYSFFSGAVDVTTTVSTNRNATYSFSGLSVNSGSPYCDVQAVLAGWALLVIYSDTSEEFRVLNVYEGFRAFQNSSLTLSLSNFTVPSSFIKGRIAHITWEGDDTLGNDGENLTFNSTTMSDSTNPSGNQFNSKSTINGDTASYGIDFDVYDLKSPIISAGQTSASTTYSTGQDLVLLSAEIIAVPNTPVADLGVTLTRNDTLIFGQNTPYTISVTNNGPNDHVGTITVTSTLPSALTYVSGGGGGWSCSNSGQNVTCSYTGGSIASGSSAPSLTLTVIPNAVSPSNITVSVTVAGALFDNVSSNNTASDTTTMSTPGYVFTDSRCVHNANFGTASQTCKVYSWTSYTAGTGASGIYITRLVGGTPTRFSNGSSTDRNVQFALSCHNPTSNAGVQATFASSTQTATMPLCTANGGTPSSYSSSITATYPAGSPSAGPFSFNYNDVGQVELFLRDVSSGSVGSSGAFVVKPGGFTILSTSIKCTTADPANCGPEALSNINGAGVNPGGFNPTGTTGKRFIRAGYPFSVTVKAVTSDGSTATPNYGKETTPETVKLTSTLVNPTAANGGHNPGVGGSFGSFSGGSATGTAFYWNEVGAITLTPSVGDGDYLGAGDVTGTVTGTIGRFYPAQFTFSNGSILNRTDLAGCSTGCSSFTYMGEQMTASFTLTAVAKDGSTVLQNYTGAYATPPATSEALSSWSRMNIAKSVTAGTGGLFDVAGVTTSGATTTAYPACGVTAAHPCITPSVASGTFISGIANITLPITVFRGTSPVANFSLKVGIAPADDDGIVLDSYDIATSGGGNDRRLVSTTEMRYGRMKIDSAHGSELHPLTISTYAQYWSSGTWVTNTDDNATPLSTSNISLDKSKLSDGSASVAVASVNPENPGKTTTSSNFSMGVNKIVLSPPGNGNSGSVDLSLDSSASVYTYLPTLSSAKARARFGVFKGNEQIIYIRESY